MRAKSAIVLITVAIVLGGLVAWRAYATRGYQTTPLTKRQVVLDTFVTVKAYGGDKKGVERAVARAFTAMRKVEKVANRYDKNSELARLNEEASTTTEPTVSVKVSDDLFDMLALSKSYYTKTDGAFDITIGPVIDAWGFGVDPGVPAEAELAEALSMVDGSKIVLDKAKSLVTMPKDYLLDLGGIAKGYAVDRASQTLQRSGVKSALIDTGSSAIALGLKPDGEPWLIGVQNPRLAMGKIMGMVKLRPGSNISTSGDYQQYFESGGKRYHHIIDPRTGRPAEGIISLTVVTSKNGAEADVLSTALFAQGFQKTQDFLEDNSSVQAIIVTSDGRVHKTGGLEKVVQDLADEVTVHD